MSSILGWTPEIYSDVSYNPEACHSPSARQDHSTTPWEASQVPREAVEFEFVLVLALAAEPEEAWLAALSDMPMLAAAAAGGGGGT